MNNHTHKTPAAPQGRFFRVYRKVIEKTPENVLVRKGAFLQTVWGMNEREVFLFLSGKAKPRKNRKGKIIYNNTCTGMNNILIEPLNIGTLN